MTRHYTYFTRGISIVSRNSENTSILVRKSGKKPDLTSYRFIFYTLLSVYLDVSHNHLISCCRDLHFQFCNHFPAVINQRVLIRKFSFGVK